MRNLQILLGLCLVTLPACQLAEPLSVHPERNSPPITDSPAKTVPVPQLITPKLSKNLTPSLYEYSAPRSSVFNGSGIIFEGITFDSRSHFLKVVDQPNGPGSQYSTSKALAQSTGSPFVINGGFFTPEGNPLGLVVSQSKRSGSWNSASSLGSGIYIHKKNGSSSIQRRQSRNQAAGAKNLLQAGPLLIENSQAVRGLSSKKLAVRSIILTDGNNRWWCGKTSPCTLASLANAISKSRINGWKVRTALNLDGGRSTDLFIAPPITDRPIERRGFLNRPVRNFLVLTAR